MRQGQKTLADAVRHVNSLDDLSGPLNAFLDALGGQADPSAFADAPATISPDVDAYLAAVAEHLLALAGLPAPAWTRHHDRFLPGPVFIPPSPGPDLRQRLLTTTPGAFRRRNIFTAATDFR